VPSATRPLWKSITILRQNWAFFAATNIHPHLSPSRYLRRAINPTTAGIIITSPITLSTPAPPSLEAAVGVLLHQVIHGAVPAQPWQSRVDPSHRREPRTQGCAAAHRICPPALQCRRRRRSTPSDPHREPVPSHLGRISSAHSQARLRALLGVARS
jgi:hypothetical protein